VSSLLFALPVGAHHSLTAEFDTKNKVTMKGVITRIEWVNPHIFVYLDVQDGAGTKPYAIETYPPNHMRSRYGLTKAVLAGNLAAKEVVTVEVNPALNGKDLGWLTQITYPDGHFIKIQADGN
jgi:hypothetical protein